ncbi:MAG TPA: response regulator [Candidatus Binatia bacterium]|nr:response regulator [Candidatus Binatia bacterium]
MLKPVLLVEDKPDDRDLVVRALKRVNCPLLIHTVATGREAIDYVTGQGQHSDRDQYPMPVLILVDNELQDMNGPQMIRELRQHLKNCPILTFTGNESPAVVTEAYDAGATGVLVKPPRLAELEKQMNAVCEFWINWCRLPASSPVRAEES